MRIVESLKKIKNITGLLLDSIQDTGSSYAMFPAVFDTQLLISALLLIELILNNIFEDNSALFFRRKHFLKV